MCISKHTLEMVLKQRFTNCKCTKYIVTSFPLISVIKSIFSHLHENLEHKLCFRNYRCPKIIFTTIRVYYIVHFKMQSKKPNRDKNQQKSVMKNNKVR